MGIAQTISRTFAEKIEVVASRSLGKAEAKVAARAAEEAIQKSFFASRPAALRFDTLTISLGEKVAGKIPFTAAGNTKMVRANGGPIWGEFLSYAGKVKEGVKAKVEGLVEEVLVRLRRTSPQTRRRGPSHLTH